MWVSRGSGPIQTARSRETIVQALESLLLDLIGPRQPDEHLLRAIERLGIDRRAHRRHTLSFLMSLPRECGNTDADRRNWITCVHESLEQLSLPLPRGVTARNFFRTPVGAQWSNHLQRPIDLGITCAKIHEAKGHEYSAVCVVIPPNRAPKNRTEALFASWETSTDAEAKRVLYVGLTRAQHLAVLAVPYPSGERTLSRLSIR